MSESARVTALAALEDFRAALCGFQVEGRQSIEAVAMEVRRAFDWLAEQKESWQRAVRERGEDVVEAKNALERKKLFKLWDRPPDTTEEEEALRRARHRLEEAEDKVEACRRWLPL